MPGNDDEELDDVLTVELVDEVPEAESGPPSSTAFH